jgi:hypothetical protein
MSQDRYDLTARRLARLFPVSFFCWLFRDFLKYLSWQRWIDTRSTPEEGEGQTTADLLAELEETTRAVPPWALLTEMSTEPDPEMFGRLLKELGDVWLTQRPQKERHARFQVAAAVINLTGTRQSTPASQDFRLPLPEPQPLGLGLWVRERYLAEESAEQALRAIEAGELERMVLPLVVLMQGAGDSGIISWWMRLASAEPDRRLLSRWGADARILAELKDWSDLWQVALKEWDVREAQNVIQWRKEGRDEGHKEGRKEGRTEGRLLQVRETLVLMLEDKFGSVPPHVRERIGAIEDVARLQQAVRQVYRVNTLEELGLFGEAPATSSGEVESDGSEPATSG